MLVTFIVMNDNLSKTPRTRFLIGVSVNNVNFDKS